MAIRGKEAIGTDHHTEMINELITLRVQTSRPIQTILNLKSLRNKINYQGYLPTVEEADDALSIVENCFNPLKEEIKKELR